MGLKVNIKDFLLSCILVICFTGTIGIAAKLWSLTDIYNVYLYPVCYYDWIFLVMSVAIPTMLFIRERGLRSRVSVSN